MFCSRNCILIQYEPGIKVVSLPCKCWPCSNCCELNKRKVRNQAYRGRPNTFITLTVQGGTGKDPAKNARELKAAWVKIRRKAKRGWGNRALPFIAVFEETQEGEPHLHILARSKWIDQDWLSDQMKAEIGAPIVHIKRVESRKKASRYISKYIGKNPEKFEKCKRWWKSRDYLVEPRKERVDPIGERQGMWFERGPLWDVVKKWTGKFYRLEVNTPPSGVEYWLVSAWEGFGNSDPPLQEGSKNSCRRSAQEPGGSQLCLQWSGCQ